MTHRPLRIIISGGGTGGHIFPAISIANKMKELCPQSEILFVGAEGKMEMEKVPAAGYRIVGLPIVGLQRQLNAKNIINDIKVPFKLMKSLSMAGRLLREFKPDIAIGVGGYASAPLLYEAQKMGIPTLIQEQNGFAGLANKILGKNADRICVAYDGMERFFPADKILKTGNPIRSEIVPTTPEMVVEALDYYHLDPHKKHIFIVGGSLGAGTLNKAVKKWISDGCPGGENVEIIWQCGRYYKDNVDAFMSVSAREGKGGDTLKYIHHFDFIGRMDLAYAVADIVISRSGASSVSELCAAGKAAVFVPSPNVAEDHQTHNAMALVSKDAAMIVKDADAEGKLLPAALKLLRDTKKIVSMENNIARLALPDAAGAIADEVYSIVDKGFGKEYRTLLGSGRSNVYFIGIGGIGMSAIARYYKFKGMNVSGYDKTPSELTKELQAEGIDVHYEDDVKYIPKDADHTLVVYTPAVPEDLKELCYVREKSYRVIKRSQILGEIAKGQKCIAVAGTHGKTTTSTLVAHILTNSGKGCSAFLGGISKNYGTNLLTSHTPLVVAEADEFDRSFLQLYPETAVITAMDADHLDIYGTLETYQQAFRDFAAQVSGTLILKKGLPVTSADTKARILTYSYDDVSADFHAENIRVDGLGYTTYDFVYRGGMIKNVKVGVPGWLNVENSIAAIAACLSYEVEPARIKMAVESFSGVQRRMDVHLNTHGMAYIDDYAHHPQELASSITALREIFPGRKLTAIFQPHLYTRTRDFADGFAEVLSKVDKLILLDIYPAREQPIPGITSNMILQRVTAPEKVLVAKEELLGYLAKEEIDVLVTFGAGNIDRLVGPITELLKERI